MMMTIKEIQDLISKMDIGKYSDKYDVYDELKKLGFSKENVRVHTGASKLCLDFVDLPFVIKWSNRGFNEALREAEIYTKAKNAGLARFFPKTDYLFYHNDIDFVIQEKIDTDCQELSYEKRELYNQKSRTASFKIISKMERKIGEACHGEYARSLNSTWASLALVLYGKAICKALCDFIVENDINDLHDCNLGYKNDRPILLDFSGYNRDDYSY